MFKVMEWLGVLNLVIMVHIWVTLWGILKYMYHVQLCRGQKLMDIVALC